ncbi:uncharacterized protein LOC117160690 isoform X2 [Bombus vancouverensis nearcticus]|uniref:uncharacterized protein LOC117160690 isoform X2 n=1 Tax=Bombus vancouverensis nearcticus TaxID=2705178 RepID=UPI00402BD4E4
MSYFYLYRNVFDYMDRFSCDQIHVSWVLVMAYANSSGGKFAKLKAFSISFFCVLRLCVSISWFYVHVISENKYYEYYLSYNYIHICVAIGG